MFLHITFKWRNTTWQIITRDKARPQIVFEAEVLLKNRAPIKQGNNWMAFYRSVHSVHEFKTKPKLLIYNVNVVREAHATVSI